MNRRILRIVEVCDITCQGVTEPVVCRAEDDCEYVVKGQHAGRKALVAEWVANRLGRLLELPIPDFALLQLDPQLLKYSAKTKEMERLGNGVLFGSQREMNVVEIRQADLDRVDETLQARVLAFDWWVANSDRIFMNGGGNPNLLWEEKTQRLVVIDHNLAFEPSLMGGFWTEHVFRKARRIWSLSFQNELKARFQSALEQLPAIWDELPEDWLSVTDGLSCASVASLLRRFEPETNQFWNSL